MKRVSLLLTILFSSFSIAIAVGHFVNKKLDRAGSPISDNRSIYSDSSAPGIPAYFNAPPDPPPGIIVKANGNVGIGTRTPTVKLDVNGNINGQGNGSFSGTVTGGSFIKAGGSASQFLKADGSVDNNSYLKTSSLGNLVEIFPVSYAYYGSWGVFPGNLATEARDWFQNLVGGTSSSEQSHNENHGVSMDFGTSVPLRSIVLFSYATRNINSYRVDYSSDNVNWTTIEVFPQPLATSPTIMNFNAGKDISARYWRWALHSWTKERQVANYYFYEMVAYM